MTYLEAMQAARDGYYVREKEMSPKWKVGYFREAKDFFCINPVTGSNYRYAPSEVEKRFRNWSKIA